MWLLTPYKIIFQQTIAPALRGSKKAHFCKPPLSIDTQDHDGACGGYIKLELNDIVYAIDIEQDHQKLAATLLWQRYSNLISSL
jgi:hypothetical protein